MEGSILKAFLAAHSDAQLADLIAAALFEESQRNAVRSNQKQANAWAAGPPLFMTDAFGEVQQTRLVPSNGIRLVAQQQHQPVTKPNDKEYVEEVEEEEVVLIVRHLPYKPGDSPTLDDDPDIAFYKPIRGMLLEDIKPSRPRNTYVPPNGGHALLYFSNLAQAQDALVELVSKKYEANFYYGGGDATYAHQ
jgi:hypothetical protein